MSLAAALAQAKPKRKGPRCTMGRLLAPDSPLGDDDREALTAALASDMFASDIAEALRAEGHDVGDHTVRYHRSGKCKCEAS